jgi:tetratricopeptide (TPR) repeat protein
MLLGTAVEDLVSRSRAASSCGIVALYQGRNEDAEAYLTRALEEFREDADGPGEASALGSLSRVNLNLGRTDKAVELAQQSLSILRREESPLRMANGQYTLGIALAQDSQHSAAVDEFNAALRSFRSSRQRLWEGMTLFRLAETRLTMDQFAEAAMLAEQALAQLRNASGPWRAKVLVVLGRALDTIGHTGRARACWEQALDVYGGQENAETAAVRNLLAATAV